MSTPRRPFLDLAQRLGHGEGMRRRLRERGLATGRPDAVEDAFLRAIHPVVRSRGPFDRRRLPTLLVLPKVGGTEDVIAATSGRPGPDVRLLGLPRAEVKAAFRALVGPGHERITDTDHRLEDALTLEGRDRYRRLLRPVLARLKEELGLVGVIGANFTYYAERDLAGACEDVDLPFLVLHKESIRSPRQREWFTRAYRERTGPFLGRAIAVYNRDERDSQVAAGAVDEATVVGAPRIDASHAVRRGRETAPQDGPVVLFAIDPRAGTWTPYDDLVETGAPRWDRLARATEDAFLAAARAQPARRFVIKAKVGHGAQLIARLPGGLPANVEVITDGTADALLRDAVVIVGFNTTVVAEGLAAGVPVVVPAFEEAAASDAGGWCYPVAESVHRVSDPRDLPGLLATLVGSSSRDLTVPVIGTLDELVGNGDGQAASRTWGWIRRTTGLD